MSNDRRERWLSVARGASLLVLLGLAGCASSPPSGAPASERSITILTMNDVYRIEGLDDGKVGGLARLRTLRAELEASAPGRVLLLHGGDVIFPSLLSREYQGKQMIDVMNLLDGDATPGRIDERMLVVFGNHEFDAESCAAPPHLQARVAESDFLWLSSNVAPSRCPDGHPRVTGVNVLHARVPSTWAGSGWASSGSRSRSRSRTSRSSIPSRRPPPSPPTCGGVAPRSSSPSLTCRRRRTSGSTRHCTSAAST